MDDGYKSLSGYYLCTDSFTEKDIDILIKMLKKKFGLTCSIYNATPGPRIYITAKSRDKFKEIVKPHMLKELYYKLMDEFLPYWHLASDVWTFSNDLSRQVRESYL